MVSILNSFGNAKEAQASLNRISNQIIDLNGSFDISRKEVYQVYVIAHLKYPSEIEFQNFLEQLELNPRVLNQLIEVSLSNIRDSKINFSDSRSSFIDLTESLYVSYSSGRTKTTRLLIGSAPNALRGCFWNHELGNIAVLDTLDPRLKAATAMDRNSFGRTAEGASFEIKHSLLKSILIFSNKNSYLLNFLGKKFAPSVYSTLVKTVLRLFKARIDSNDEQFTAIFYNGIFMNDYADWNRITLSRIKLLVQETDVNLFLTLHDDIVYRKPNFFPDQRLVEFMSVLDLARVATCIFVPSHTVKEFVAKHFQENTQIVVVPFSGSHVLNYSQNITSSRSIDSDDQVTFLHFLGNDPRKNFIKTLTAFLTLAKKGSIFKLHIVGPNPHKKDALFSLFDELSKLGIHQEFFQHLSEESLSFLYQRSDCLVYCSLDEGFGLPIAEAGELGCGVVTSNFGSMLEVGQRYRNVSFVNPNQTREIEEALEGFIQNKYRRNLVATPPTSTWKSAFEVILKTMGVEGEKGI